MNGYLGMYKGIGVTVNGEMSDKEVQDTIKFFQDKYPEKDFVSFEFTVDGDYLDVNYKCRNTPFERIRRITGYLVGTLDRFNDAKRAEVEDRVKHGIGESVALDDIC